MSKNEINFWIKNKGYAKLSDTKPEKAQDEFAQTYLFDCHPVREPVTFYDEDGKRWDVTPDRDVALRGAEPFYWHADGPHHWTKKFRAKDDWQDRQLVKLGKKVFRTDSPILLDKTKWPGLWKQMTQFAYSPETRKARIYA